MAKVSVSTHALCRIDWIRRKRWPSVPGQSRPALRLVDLFCGCGGLTLGVWEAARANGRRLDIRLAVDNSPDAIAVYRHNFRVAPKIARQIDVAALFSSRASSRLSKAEEIALTDVGRVDLLVAGPPCQGHSDLNNHTRRDDPRNGLYLRVIRAAEVLKPGVVLIENVGTVIHDSSNVIERGIGRLRRCGYTVEHRFVRTDALGLPQRRKRHILLAIRRKGVDVGSMFPIEAPQSVPISAFIDDICGEPDKSSDLFRTPSRTTLINRKRIAYLFKNNIYDLPNAQRPPCHANGHSYKSMYGRLMWNKPAQTITTGFGSMGQGRFVHPKRRRMLTPHEAARIQGLPDFFDFSKVTKRTRLQELIGNTVPPAIASGIIGRVISISNGR